jgi:hypothetical protein
MMVVVGMGYLHGRPPPLYREGGIFVALGRGFWAGASQIGVCGVGVHPQFEKGEQDDTPRSTLPNL